MAGWGLAGCPSPDAAGKYDRFNEQTADEREVPDAKLDLGGPPVGETEGGAFPDISGTYLMAIDTSINPGLPLQFLAEVTAELDMMGDGPIAVEFQPLSLDVMSTTEPREEVGDTISATAEASGGSFILNFGETSIIGEANPITGSEITADIALESTIRNIDAWCGNATGDVLSPIQVPLAGSTFAAIRLADRQERPVMFPVSCATVEEMGIGAGDDTGSTGM